MTSAPRHVLALDAARAIAIIGIVVNHAWVSLDTSGISAQQGLLAEVNDAAVLARIPALCFFIGIFIPGRRS
jgi:peptidoglycan/LPS O-acetylase OafA/YrhL